MNKFIKGGEIMPRVIENLREEIIKEAKKQISERGYKNTTIRSVASECNIAVGTVYNYFKSKESLVASFVLEDWNECVRSIEEQPRENRRAYLAYIYISLRKFAEGHSAIFEDKDAAKVYSMAFSQWHKLLRERLADLILPICMGEDQAFLSQYVAEALLTWTMEGVAFDRIYSMLPQQIK